MRALGRVRPFGKQLSIDRNPPAPDSVANGPNRPQANIQHCVGAISLWSELLRVVPAPVGSLRRAG
jgi:hypothetical protein